MRLFVAIEIPAALHAALAAVCERVGAEGWRFTAAHQLHITLRFLGDVPSDRVADLCGALDIVTSRRAPFALHLGGVGVFGNARHPRVVWAGVHDAPALTTLVHDLDVSLEQVAGDVVGARDRAFTAHVTLGRAKPKGRDRPARVAHPERAGDVGTMAVDELVLFDSAPSPVATTQVWKGRLRGSG